MMHEGHRQRILERLQADDGLLGDHELLEILLFNAIPRKNTNGLAHALLDTFGSLEGVLNADISGLKLVDGIGESTAAYLRVIGLVYGRVKAGKNKQPSLFSASAFGEYLSESYRGLNYEVLDVYCLDSFCRINFFKRFTSGNEGRVSIRPEEMTALISSRHPYGIVLSHNHVVGSFRPSSADDQFTAQVQLLCSINNVKLFDHLVVAEDGYFSYYSSGRMDKIRNQFNVQSLLGKLSL